MMLVSTLSRRPSIGQKDTSCAGIISFCGDRAEIARFLHTAVGIQIPLPVPTHARVTYKKLGQDMRYACSIRPRLVKPTVSLGVTSAVVSSCGHASGHIEQPVAHEWAGHWATHEGPAERPQHRRPPQAQTLSPVEAFPVKT
jgi:hypothetical protein